MKLKISPSIGHNLCKRVDAVKYRVINSQSVAARSSSINAEMFKSSWTTEKIAMIVQSALVTHGG